MKIRFLAVLLIVSCLFVGSDKNYACINDPPNVNITYPYSGTIFAEGDNVLINASASDSDGYVTKVEFYKGSTKLGEDTSAPYSFMWYGVPASPAGGYNLTAKAFDNGGAITTSTAVNIKVTDVWYVDPDALNVNGQSWGYAFHSLQDALYYANSGDEIRVAEGIYKPDRGAQVTLGERGETFQLKNGVTIYGGFAGYTQMPPPGSPPPDPPPPDPDTRDITKYKTVLSGDIDDDDLDNGMPDKENSYHVVTGADGAILDGFTITRGYADDDAGGGGGGMFNNNNGSQAVLNCIFEYNVAAGNQQGGAVYNGSGSNLQLINCLLIGNMGQGNSGGAIYHNGGTIWMNNCTVANNAGDGIHCDGANLMIENSVIWYNRTVIDDFDNFPRREIVLQNGATATINYSNIENGQTSVIGSGLTWGAGNASGTEEPEFVQSGTWKWKLANGDDVVQGTPLQASADDITIYDFLIGRADMGAGMPGVVENELADEWLHSDPDDPIYGYAYKTPAYEKLPGEKQNTISNKDNFYAWWTGNTFDGKGPKRSQEVSWECRDPDKGIFRFNDEHFFPIDNWCADPVNGCGGDPDCEEFCDEDIECYDQGTWHPEVISPPDPVVTHNNFFTFQYHGEYTYIPGQKLFFKASDDLFVAINNRVVVDRGGYFDVDEDEVGGPSETTVWLKEGKAYVYEHEEPPVADPYDLEGLPQPVAIDDIVATTGLEPYKTYDFDLFFAQRATKLSVLVAERTPGDSEIVASFEPGDYHLQPGSVTEHHPSLIWEHTSFRFLSPLMMNTQ
jgi:fibro-slime domain-containing protein